MLLRKPNIKLILSSTNKKENFSFMDLPNGQLMTFVLGVSWFHRPKPPKTRRHQVKQNGDGSRLQLYLGAYDVPDGSRFAFQQSVCPGSMPALSQVGRVRTAWQRCMAIRKLGRDGVQILNQQADVGFCEMQCRIL